MLSLSVKCSLIIFLIIFFNVYKIKLSVLFYMRMPLKIFCENRISNQFPNILEAFTLIIFQLKPALLFYASNPFNFVLKKKILQLSTMEGKKIHYIWVKAFGTISILSILFCTCLVRCEENSWINDKSRADLWFMRLQWDVVQDSLEYYLLGYSVIVQRV